MIHCALCFHDSGTMHKTVYCAVRSILENSSEKVHIHLLIDDTVIPNKHWFEELCAEFDSPLSFYDNVTVPDDVVGLYPNGRVGNYTQASLFRMCLHEQLPEEVEKVIYLDCDIIVERDIADFWNLELSDAWAVATHDSERRWSSRKKEYYLKALNIPEERYFNSGVLLMNLKALREASKDENIFWKAYKELSAQFSSLKFQVYDQDLLNYMLCNDHDKLKLVDADFNYELCLWDRRFMRLEEMKGKILHYAALKPWEKFFPATLAYWKYYAKSPWRDEVLPMLEERMFDPKDRIWPILLWIMRRHTSLRWISRLYGAR